MASNIWCSRDCAYSGAAEKCSRLDRLGVPNEFIARVAAAYFDEELFHDHLEGSVRKNILDTFSSFAMKRDYSDDALIALFRERDRIITEPFKELSKKLVVESAKTLSSINQSLDTHIHSLSSFEEEILMLFEHDAPKEEILNRVQQSFNMFKVSLTSSMAALKKLALYDSTSGLSNRRSFDEFIEDAIEEHKKTGKLFGLAMLDIDNFKHFNDMYGHRVGDQVIALVGREMRKLAESLEDANTRFFPSRFGGEEFTIVASGEHAQILPLLTKRIRDSIASFNFLIRDATGNVLKDNVRISVSAGVVLSSKPTHTQTAAFFIEQADRALYNAKKRGKNRVFLCSNSNEIPYILISR